MIKIIVPVSGGKDSQACLKLARQYFPKHEVRGLFCDTQFEHPLTYAHIQTMRKLYDVEIERVSNGSVVQQTFKHWRFPSWRARFCTEELKIWPTKWYCKALAERQGGFELWYGMRADESRERSIRYAGKIGDEVYPPHEVLAKYPKYLHKLGVRFRLPIVEWSKFDVLEFLNGEENPLYRAGFTRVGCFPCQAAGDKDKEAAYQYDIFGASQYRTIKIVSEYIGKPMFTSKGGIARDGAGCSICMM